MFRQLLPKYCTVVGATGSAVVGSRAPHRAAQGADGYWCHYQRHEGDPGEKNRELGAITATLIHTPPGVNFSTFCAGSVTLLRGLTVTGPLEPLNPGTPGPRLDVYGEGPNRGLPDWRPGDPGPTPHFIALFNEEDVSCSGGVVYA